MPNNDLGKKAVNVKALETLVRFFKFPFYQSASFIDRVVIPNFEKKYQCTIEIGRQNSFIHHIWKAWLDRENPKLHDLVKRTQGCLVYTRSPTQNQLIAQFGSEVIVAKKFINIVVDCKTFSGWICWPEASSSTELKSDERITIDKLIENSKSADEFGLGCIKAFWPVSTPIETVVILQYFADYHSSLGSYHINVQDR